MESSQVTPKPDEVFDVVNWVTNIDGHEVCDITTTTTRSWNPKIKSETVQFDLPVIKSETVQSDVSKKRSIDELLDTSVDYLLNEIDTSSSHVFFPRHKVLTLMQSTIDKMEFKCSICLDDIEDCTVENILSQCGHVFHPECIANELCCPLCRVIIPGQREQIRQRQEEQMRQQQEEQIQQRRQFRQHLQQLRRQQRQRQRRQRQLEQQVPPPLVFNVNVTQAQPRQQPQSSRHLPLDDLLRKKRMLQRSISNLEREKVEREQRLDQERINRQRTVPAEIDDDRQRRNLAEIFEARNAEQEMQRLTRELQHVNSFIVLRERSATYQAQYVANVRQNPGQNQSMDEAADVIEGLLDSDSDSSNDSTDYSP